MGRGADAPTGDSTGAGRSGSA